MKIKLEIISKTAQLNVRHYESNGYIVAVIMCMKDLRILTSFHGVCSFNAILSQ